MNIRVYGESPSTEDPTQDFTTGLPDVGGTTLASLDVAVPFGPGNNFWSMPLYNVIGTSAGVPSSSNLGSAIRVYIGVPAGYSVTLSGELSIKS